MIELIGKHGKDCKIYVDDPEEDVIQFLYKVLDNDISQDIPIRVMPDCHSGTGCIVGLTLPTETKVNPEYIGCDIGCGVVTFISKTAIPDSPDLAKIDYKIRNLIPMGMEINEKPIVDEKEFYRYLRTEYSKARSAWPEVIPDVGEIGEKYLRDMLRRLGMDQGVFYKSLGSLGGGNHFIEVSETPDKNWAITVHCGSRNFGIKVWKYWSKIGKSMRKDEKRLKPLEAEIRAKYSGPEIERRIKILRLDPTYNLRSPNGFLGGSDMSGYLSDMCIAQAYASYNRYLIVKRITSALRWKELEKIESVHNYLDFTDHILRKGSIRSYLDEKLIIPLNMADGILVCKGKSNPDWNYSAPHGAGRKFSRSTAKKNITLDSFRERMVGVFSTSVCKETIDESPMAYKDSELIESLIEPTVEVLYKMKPMINLKSANILDKNEED